MAVKAFISLLFSSVKKPAGEERRGGEGRERRGEGRGGERRGEEGRGEGRGREGRGGEGRGERRMIYNSPLVTASDFIKCLQKTRFCTADVSEKYKNVTETHSNVTTVI